VVQNIQLIVSARSYELMSLIFLMVNILHNFHMVMEELILFRSIYSSLLC